MNDNKYKILFSILLIIFLLLAFLVWLIFPFIKYQSKIKKTGKRYIASKSVVYQITDMNQNLLNNDEFKRVVILENDKYLGVQNKDRLDGVIDTTGKYIIPCKYRRVNFYNSKYFLASTKDMNYVFDISGNLIMEAPSITFRGNLCIASYGDNEYVIYDENLKKLLKTHSNRMPQPVLNNKLIKIYKDDNVQVVDLKGNIVVADTEENNRRNRSSSSSNIIIDKPLVSPVKPYESDYGKNKKTGDFTKLTCNPLTKNHFCNLSPNGLSAKYCGKESYYTVNNPKDKGKYYFEFQISRLDTKEKVPVSSRDKLSFLIFFTSQMINTYNASNYMRDIKTNDIIGVAMDLDNARAHICVNGRWKTNPYESKNGIKLKESKLYYPSFTVSGYNELLSVNFGAQTFRYPIPKGYKAYSK